MNARAGIEEVIDLTLVSESLAGISRWKVIRDNTIGSDHDPIMTEISLNVEEYGMGVAEMCFSSADWESFRLISEQELQKVDLSVGVDDFNLSVCCAILKAAN